MPNVIFHLPRSILGPSLCPWSLTPADFISWAPLSADFQLCLANRRHQQDMKSWRREKSGHFSHGPSGSSYIPRAWWPLFPVPDFPLGTLFPLPFPKDGNDSHCYQCLSALASLLSVPLSLPTCWQQSIKSAVNSVLSDTWNQNLNLGAENPKVTATEIVFLYKYILAIYYWKIIYEFGLIVSQEINLIQ